MEASKKGGYLTLKIRYLNGRLFSRYLAEDGRSLYNADQGKILSALWEKSPQSSKELAQATAMTVSGVSLMLKKLEENGLIQFVPDEMDKRVKWVQLTELGLSQKEVGEAISQQLADVFYQGFSEQEIEQVESYLERIEENLLKASQE